MVDRSGKNIHFFLYIRVLPSHKRLESVNKVISYEPIFSHRSGSFSWIIFQKICQKLFQIILTILIVKVEGKCNRGDGKYFQLFGLAVNL